jgi:PrtD family type I secretion system ABC transporter
MLTLIVAFVYLISAALETIRSKLLVRAGVFFDCVANPDVFRAVQRATLLQPSPRHTQSLRDIDTIREFFTGAGLLAFCDFPWVPVYVIAAFTLHPIYGVLAIGGAVITFALAATNEYLTRAPLNMATQEAMTANSHSVMTFRNSEVLQAMGMVESIRARWSKHHEGMLSWQAEASNRGGLVLSITKFVRMLLQSLILGVGAYLVIQRDVSAGMMIAASIIIGKALAPVEIAISQWKSFTNMRDAYRRVNGLLSALPVQHERMNLPAPKGQVTLEGVTAAAPGRKNAVLTNISMTIPAGAVVGVVGPSAAGKSSLARVMVGVWPIAAGAVRIDGSDITHWNAEALGAHIGYLPQDVEMFSGTIAENISRFSPSATDEQIIAAAQMAGVHDMIQYLPDGYNTYIGDNGQALSGGQRQRIGLARALFGLPAFIVLDEPNANLDAQGEAALLQALAALKEANRTVILITHKTNVLSATDHIIVMNNGQIQTAGPRDQVLAAVLNQQNPGARPKVQAVPA